MSARDSLEGPAGQTSGNFDLASDDPELGPLADNGGPTETQALGVGSPAIDAVTAAGVCPVTDQRGAERGSGPCDVGAYEVAPPDVDTPANSYGIGTTTAILVDDVSNPDVETGTVVSQYGTSTAYGTTTAAQVMPVGGPPAPLYSASLTGLTPGTVYHFRVVAQNPDGTVYGPDGQFTTTTPSSSLPSNTFTFGEATVGPAGKITLPVNAPDAGRFTAKATFTVRQTVIKRKGGRRIVEHVTRTFTYGTATVTSSGRGTFKLVIGRKALAGRELKLLGSRQVTIAVTFTPTGGTAHAMSKKLTVRRSRKGRYS